MDISEENVKQAEQEYRNVLKWAAEEEDALAKRLKEEGKWENCLDGNSADFSRITKEVIRRTKDIQQRYGIIAKKGGVA